MDPLLLCYDRQSTSLRQNYRMAEGLHVLISSTLDVRKETYLASTFAGHFETYLMSFPGHRTDVLACRTPIHHVQADV